MRTCSKPACGVLLLGWIWLGCAVMAAQSHDADVAIVVCEPEPDRVLTLGPIFKFLDDHKIPHMVFINKMDTASARVRDVLAALQGASQQPLVLRQVPLRGGAEGAITGYVDLVSERAYKYKPGQPSDLIKLPDGFWDAERPTRAIRLRNIGPAHRRRLVTTRLDAIQEVQEIGFQVCRIVVRRHTVDARSTILAGEPVGFLHPFQIDDVVQRRQRHSSFRSCQFSYPLSFRGQVCETQGPLPCFSSTVLFS